MVPILFGGLMARGIMCECGCKSIITEINPKTNRIFSKCEKSRKEYTKTSSARRKQNRNEGMDHARNKSGSLIYDTRAWRRLSDKKRTVNPFCERCLKEGRHVVAKIVDHKVEIKDGGKPYEWSNLESMCYQCHNTKTQDEKDKRNGKAIFQYA